MLIQGRKYRTVWMEEGIIKTINQPLLPHKFEIISIKNYEEVFTSIKTMVIRGAPAIGAMAAYGIAQAIMQFGNSNVNNLRQYISVIGKRISDARPTAHDLSHAVEYITNSVNSCTNIEEAKKQALQAAEEYASNSVEECKKIGEFGAKIINNNSNILTHCNAGALATVDYGTALAPIRVAHHSGKRIHVYVDETRPRAQGSRLTAFELAEENIPHTIIADNAAGHFMKIGKIDLCIVGADRISLNGDVANKIGTYEKAVLAFENKIPFYVAAPISTFDLSCIKGDNIIIEERAEEEVLFSYGWADTGDFSRVRIAPLKSHAENPAFDITPAKYIRGIITPKGIIKANEEEIKKLFTI